MTTVDANKLKAATELLAAHASKSNPQEQINEKALKLIESAATGFEAVQIYYTLFPSVIKLGHMDITLAGTHLTLPVIFKIALSIDSPWFHAFFKGIYKDSASKTLKEVDSNIFELFKDHFYKKVPLKSFDEKIELL